MSVIIWVSRFPSFNSTNIPKKKKRKRKIHIIAFIALAEYDIHQTLPFQQLGNCL